ncbi:MAG: glycosyltransferase family 4 protein [Chloroflexi bacterium]|nr:glycosyltransferase family 4 protein [Chloroflexota bacterium]
MKIACVNLHWPRTLESGVGKKIDNQLSLWRENGNEVKLFMHMHNEKSDQTLLDGDYFEYENNDSIKELLSTEISRSRAMKKLIDSVRIYQPDIIYFRNSMFVYPLHDIFSIAPVILEIISIDVFEHRLLGFPYSLYNRITRGICLSRASGMVFVSREVSRSPYFTKFNKPQCVIGDGVPLDRIPEIKAPNNQIPIISFVGSPGKIWHGVDKLLDLAKLCPDIRVHVIGYDRSEVVATIPDNLIFLGYLKGDAYSAALARSDVAISSLALHRYQLQEMSTLKTREYAAMGIPVIIPYTDTDLHATGLNEILEIENNERNVLNSANQIRDFAYSMRGKRIKRNEINNLIDSSVKEKQRLSFFEKILAQR